MSDTPSSWDATTWIEHATFHLRHHGPRYRELEVDEFLDRVTEALRTGRPVPDMASARFPGPRLGRGYDAREVDEFLDELATRLAGATSGPQAPVAPAPAWPATAPTAPVQAPPPVVPPAPVETGGSVELEWQPPVIDTTWSPATDPTAPPAEND